MTARKRILAAGLAAALPLLVSAGITPRPLLVWNTTASAPLGFYAIAAPRRPRLGDLVVARAPEAYAAWFDRLGFLPRGVPLLKTIGAVAGQEVCRLGPELLVDHRKVARLRGLDRFGRPLPHWSGCRTLRPGQVLLLNAHAPDSLDGRYFGPSPAADIVGRATPLFTWGRR